MHHHALLPVGGDFVLLFAASLLGSAHCIGMCGPYVAMCTAQFVPRGSTVAARFFLRLVFNLGRIATYGVIGLIVGAFGQIALAFAARVGLNGMVAIAAGAAAVLFGLSLMGWIRDPARLAAYAGVDRVLRAGRTRLTQASPMVAPLFLGMLQGWLPCALVYAAASRAAVAGSAGMGALTMLIFGLGTLPAVFALTVVPQTVLRRVKAQRLAGVLLTVLGLVLILRGLASFGLIPSTVMW
ncbi:MAG TPA: sulfite exporter TauE/SafE family protein [Steroidobacteraceae bacterium]|nr:sulfite exporter TauE/SafE family protein [Steroidobacteraceae bacterium]